MEFMVGVAGTTDPNSGVRFSLIPLEGIASFRLNPVAGVDALGSKNDPVILRGRPK
jgi:hypothetical protein